MNARALARQFRELTVGENLSPIRSPEQAHVVALATFPEHVEQEHFVGIALDVRHRVIDAACLTTGTHTQTIVAPDVLFRWALTRKRPCHAIIVAHNHPSGDETPSLDDFTATTRLVELGQLLGIRVLDHLVVAGPRFVSLRTTGGIPTYETQTPTTQENRP